MEVAANLGDSVLEAPSPAPGFEKQALRHCHQSRNADHQGMARSQMAFGMSLTMVLLFQTSL